MKAVKEVDAIEIDVIVDTGAVIGVGVVVADVDLLVAVAGFASGTNGCGCCDYMNWLKSGEAFVKRARNEMETLRLKRDLDSANQVLFCFHWQ